MELVFTIVCQAYFQWLQNLCNKKLTVRGKRERSIALIIISGLADNLVTQ